MLITGGPSQPGHFVVVTHSRQCPGIRQAVKCHCEDRYTLHLKLASPGWCRAGTTGPQDRVAPSPPRVLGVRSDLWEVGGPPRRGSHTVLEGGTAFANNLWVGVPSCWPPLL